MGPAIVFDNVRKGFADKTAVADLSFSVPRGETTQAYQGTITDDFISGTMEYQFSDRDPRKRSFTATRERP